MDILFKTVHGSRLYGLSHADSDYDYYTVIRRGNRRSKSKYARQSIKDGIDSFVIDFTTWLRYCEMGVPQALEAMFSDRAIIDCIPDFRNDFRVATGVWDRYIRTIDSFLEEQDFKKNRHALRLALNLGTLRATGRFNPTLTQDEIDFIHYHVGEDVEYLKDLARYVALSVD